ncbi:aldo/keto reductase [Desulfonatronospira sp.]|uniref:aldo/keto reductase n=1 Tax=Desulfonatronospira sp. TaxID=1962951 RepID=UPI0025BCB149|nr:aldo/keto reductase [Desulfonatronospira sp.]
MQKKMDRRRFMCTTAGTVAGLGITGIAAASGPGAVSAADLGSKGMPRRKLGRTGHQVSIFSLGGEATVQQAGRQDEAVAILEKALDLGVNYIDTSPTYGGGGSESNIGRVMARRRKEVFLASKTQDRTYDGTMRLIEQSLERLETDYLDLYQVHNVRVNNDVDQALGRQGAVRAMEKLKSEKVIRNIGITGHKDPDVLIQGITRYDFDTVLLTLNAGDIYYRPFQEDLLEKAAEKQMGIIAMKVTAVSRILKPGGAVSMQEALGYTLSFPVSTAIVGISSVEQVEENARIAREFESFSSNKLARIEDKVRPNQDQANFFKHYW